jgi:hypothetical protein
LLETGMHARVFAGILRTMVAESRALTAITSSPSRQRSGESVAQRKQRTARVDATRAELCILHAHVCRAPGA